MTEQSRYDRQCRDDDWDRTVIMLEHAKQANASELTDDELVEKIRDNYIQSDTRYGPEDKGMRNAYLRLTGYCAEARNRGKPNLAERGRQLAREFLGINKDKVQR